MIYRLNAAAALALLFMTGNDVCPIARAYLDPSPAKNGQILVDCEWPDQRIQVVCPSLGGSTGPPARVHMYDQICGKGLNHPGRKGPQW